MALNPSILEKGFEDMSTNASEGMVVTYSDFIAVVEKYAFGMQFPPPAGVGPGAQILKSLLDTIPTNPPLPIATPIIKLSLQLFALMIQMGFPANPADLMAVPTIAPAGQPPIDGILGQPNDKKVVAKQLASAIHTWMISGTYDNGAFVVISGAPVPKPVIVPWT